MFSAFFCQSMINPNNSKQNSRTLLSTKRLAMIENLSYAKDVKDKIYCRFLPVPLYMEPEIAEFSTPSYGK